MLNSMRRNVAKQQGVAAIEFALGFFAFWLMCMAWVEMSYMSYISAIADLAISEASREAKLQDSDYITAFQNTLKKSDSIWAGVVDSGNFRISIRYLAEVKDLAEYKDPCLADKNNPVHECGVAINSAIAIYRIDYDFNSIFSYFMDKTTVFSREVIVIQEYQRSAFKIETNG